MSIGALYDSYDEDETTDDEEEQPKAVIDATIEGEIENEQPLTLTYASASRQSSDKRRAGVFESSPEVEAEDEEEEEEEVAENIADAPASSEDASPTVDPGSSVKEFGLSIFRRMRDHGSLESQLPTLSTREKNNRSLWARQRFTDQARINEIQSEFDKLTQKQRSYFNHYFNDKQIMEGIYYLITN